MDRFRECFSGLEDPRMFEQQRRILEQVMRRTEDRGARKPYIAKGPDLQDHYGKRSRDVDVERI